VGVAVACLSRDLALFFRMKEVMEDSREKLPSAFIEPISEPKGVALGDAEMNPGKSDIDSPRFSVGTKGAMSSPVTSSNCIVASPSILDRPGKPKRVRNLSSERRSPAPTLRCNLAPLNWSNDTQTQPAVLRAQLLQKKCAPLSKILIFPRPGFL